MKLSKLSKWNSVEHGLYGIVGLLIPSLAISMHYGGAPSMAAFVAVAMAFLVGETRGKAETYESFRGTIAHLHRRLANKQKALDYYMWARGEWADEALLLRKKVQRLTERFVHGK